MSDSTAGQFFLKDSSYGKTRVRLVKVTRDTDRHDLRDVNVNIVLEGDFEACYVEGDNTDILATDTMRNTVYALAKNHPLVDIESFGVALAQHFLANGPRVEKASIQITEYPWSRIKVAGTEHDHAFTRAAGERTAWVKASNAGISIEAGIDNLLILKTTNSGWEDFYREQYTTLPDARDRILATILQATWSYGSETDLPFTALWGGIRSCILASFTDHYSPSVQHTIYRMGEAVLQEFPQVEEIHFKLPNKHHLLFNLAQFGMENNNEIFIATDEPFGQIEATIARVAS